MPWEPTTEDFALIKNRTNDDDIKRRKEDKDRWARTEKVFNSINDLLISFDSGKNITWIHNLTLSPNHEPIESIDAERIANHIRDAGWKVYLKWHIKGDDSYIAFLIHNPLLDKKSDSTTYTRESLKYISKWRNYTHHFDRPLGRVFSAKVARKKCIIKCHEVEIELDKLIGENLSTTHMFERISCPKGIYESMAYDEIAKYYRDKKGFTVNNKGIYFSD